MVDVTLDIAFILLLLGMVFSFLRLFRGPDLLDRVVALDLIAALAAGLAILFIIRSGEKRYLDIVLIFSLIVFLGTVAIARMINKEKK